MGVQKYSVRITETLILGKGIFIIVKRSLGQPAQASTNIHVAQRADF